MKIWSSPLSPKYHRPALESCTKRYWFCSTSNQLQYFYTVLYEKWFETSEQLTLQLWAKHTRQLHDERNCESVLFDFVKVLKMVKADRNNLANNMNQLLTYLEPYSTHHSPSWKAKRFAGSQEIPRIFWNPKVNHLIRKCRKPAYILSPLDTVHTPHLTSWRSNLILSCHLCLIISSGLCPSGFATKTCARLSSPIRATCLAHLIKNKEDDK